MASLLVLSVLTFVCAHCQPLVISRVQHQYSSLKNGKVLAIAFNDSGVCNQCVNSTCNLPSGYCFINGMCVQDGDSFYACLQCNSSQNKFEWSYNPACVAGNARCSDRKFIARHVCDASTINAFYTDFHNAAVTLFNVKNCSSFACEPGFFFATSVNSGGNSTHPVLYSCCPGYFCPDGQICMIPCRNAAYCPSPLMPKNGFCLTDAQCPQNVLVPFTEYGCGGSSVEGFCESKSYCPNPSTKISCENLASDYCASGVIEPIICPIGFTCQEGILDNKRIRITAIVVVSVLLSLVLLFYLIVCLGVLRFVAKKYERCSCFSSEVNNQRKQQYVVQQEPSAYFKTDTETRLKSMVLIFYWKMPNWTYRNGKILTKALHLLWKLEK
jgi:hypothetical protein